MVISFCSRALIILISKVAFNQISLGYVGSFILIPLITQIHTCTCIYYCFCSISILGRSSCVPCLIATSEAMPSSLSSTTSRIRASRLLTVNWGGEMRVTAVKYAMPAVHHKWAWMNIRGARSTNWMSCDHCWETTGTCTWTYFWCCVYVFGLTA